MTQGVLSSRVEEIHSRVQGGALSLPEKGTGPTQGIQPCFWRQGGGVGVTF